MQYLNTAHPHKIAAFITQDKALLYIHNTKNFNQIHKYKKHQQKKSTLREDWFTGHQGCHVMCHGQRNP